MGVSGGMGGAVTSYAKIQVLEAFLEEVELELSLEKWLKIC